VNKRWIISLCLAAVVGATMGFLCANLPSPPLGQGTLTRNASGLQHIAEELSPPNRLPTYGFAGYLHEANPKISTTAMAGRARFPLYEPTAPGKYSPLDIRYYDNGAEIQGFIEYYDTDEGKSLDQAAIMVIQTTTGRTPEMEAAFIKGVREIAPEIPVETIGNVDGLQ